MKHNNMYAQVLEAQTRLTGLVNQTPLQLHDRLSKQYGAEIYMKREDLQKVRSYKLRGAYNRMLLLSREEKDRGVVCASAGNHAQGVAYVCTTLKIHGTIYMPTVTPVQKVERVKMFGGSFVSVVLVGDTFDEAATKAKEFCKKQQKTFVHPFDDLAVIAGQGTVAVEVVQSITPDVVIVPVGGGGLLAGVASYFAEISPQTKIIAVEPQGAPSLTQALQAGHVVTLDKVDTFVDGAAVKTVGTHTFSLIQPLSTQVQLVLESVVSRTIIDMYQYEGIVVEPAGALALAALSSLKHELQGKKVVCIVSGGNNDVYRYTEIIQRSKLLVA